MANVRWSNAAEPVVAGDFGSDVVVAAAEILHEGMTGGRDPR